MRVLIHQQDTTPQRKETTVKVFFEALVNGEYVDKKRLADIPDNVAYARALKAYPDDKEYVESMLDGRGYITIRGHKCRFTYQQDDL